MLRNHLIFHTGALGDFILSWPLALALSRLYPHGRIIYVTHRSKGRLAEAVLGVESADIDSAFAALWSPTAMLPAQAQAMLAGAAGIYTFAAGPDNIAAENMRRCAPQAPMLFLRTVPPDGFAAHAVDYLVDQLKSLPALAECTAGAARYMRQYGLCPRRTPRDRLLVIHPGSGSMHKCWPADGFVEVARAARAAGALVRFVLGEAELERWPADRIDALAAAAEVCCPDDYLELAAVLRSAAACLGNDSGPSHLAGALGVPTACIFGPTSPATWAPLGPAVRVLHGRPIDSITVADVLHVVDEMLKTAR